MLVEFLDQDILVDSKKFARDFRVNIDDQKRMRLKVKFYDQKDETKDLIPLDLIVRNFDKKIEGMGFAISLTGKENVRNIPFSFKLQFSIIKRKWIFSGSFNNKEIHKVTDNICDIGPCIRDLL